MTHFILADQADDDLIQIAEYLAETVSESAALKIFDRIYEAAELIAALPSMGAPRDELDRRLRAHATGKYMICYRIEDDVVKITRILHQRRDISKVFGRR